MRGHDELFEPIFRFAWAYDEGDSELLASCFHENAVVEHGGRELRSRTAICENLEQARARRRARGQQTRHVITNPVVFEQSDADASVGTYLAFTVTESDGTSSLMHTGRYLDRLVRTADGWKIIERKNVPDKNRRAVEAPLGESGIVDHLTSNGEALAHDGEA